MMLNIQGNLRDLRGKWSRDWQFCISRIIMTIMNELF